MQIFYVLLFPTLLSSLSEEAANNFAWVGCWGKLCTQEANEMLPHREGEGTSEENQEERLA